VPVATFARIVLIVTLGVLTVRSLRDRPIPLDELRRRLPRCLVGLACFGVGITLFVRSDLGTPPWDVLHGGLADLTGLDFGLIINLVGLAVLPMWIPLKERIGLGTVLNTLEIGLVVDLVKPMIGKQAALPMQLGFVIAGTVIIALGSGLYIGSGLGAGPRDGIMMGLRRLGLSVRAARTLVELTTVALGFLLGGTVGVGTVVFLVAIGPLVQFFLGRLSLPPLTPPAVPVAEVAGTPTQQPV
jgi:uncharacterized membrane protein YczE